MILGMSWNTILHHLRHMEASGRLTSCKVQGRVCWFDRRQGAYKVKAGTALLRNVDNKRLAIQIMMSPGRNQLQLATELNLATSVVHRRVVQMEEAGLIHRTPISRSVVIHPSDELMEVADRAGVITPEMRMKLVPPPKSVSRPMAAPILKPTTPSYTSSTYESPLGANSSTCVKQASAPASA